MEKIVKSGERVTHVTLDGTECAVRFSAEYRVFYVKSEGSEVLVSLRSGAVRGDDGTLICPSGGSVGYPHMRHVNTVYLTGTGDVTVFAGNEADAAPFKSAAQGGGAASGSGVSQGYVDSRDNAILDAAKEYADGAAEKINVKNAIACDTKPTYADGSITYVKGGITYTTADTETWFYYNDGEELKQTIFVDGEEFTITSAGKVDFSEFVEDSDVVSVYTGSEGDTSKIPDLAALRMLDAKITGNISNPNLLINPDFSINQRGQTEYLQSSYTVDHWRTDSRSTLQLLESGAKRIYASDAYSGEWRAFAQYVENLSLTDTYTISVKVTDVKGEWFIPTATNNYNPLTVGINTRTDSIFSSVGIAMKNVSAGDYIDIEWIKLELGSIATPFVPPDPATELVKCQRYYCKQEKINTVSIINTSYANVSANFPTEMRTTPTVTIRSVSGTDNTISYWDSLTDAVSDVAANLASLTHNGFSSISTNNGFTADKVYTFGYVADAEIY
ncbi:MAG: hypothetical protein IJ416_05910 [Ruminiclostridium sp.]|nr:hypothetical protein [Ruminiclostridium sp.]